MPSSSRLDAWRCAALVIAWTIICCAEDTCRPGEKSQPPACAGGRRRARGRMAHTCNFYSRNHMRTRRDAARPKPEAIRGSSHRLCRPLESDIPCGGADHLFLNHNIAPSPLLDVPGVRAGVD